MFRLARFLGSLLGRFLVWLRYRVYLHGGEQLSGLRGPVLLLPNHPALIDPVIVLATLWPRLRPRPMLYEGNFLNPVLWPVMMLLDAIRVPDLSQPSARARARAEQAVAEAIASLRRGQNVILWPAGRIERAGYESLGAARATADILQAVPQAQVVLVKTRGVWGSMFSFAPTMTYPKLVRGLWRSVGLLLANLILLMPRRRVDITVEPIDRARLPALERETLNPWLEAWYNSDARPERPTYVPYHFLFGPRTYQFPSGPGTAEANLVRVKPETKEEVHAIIEKKLRRPLTAEEQGPATTLDQLGLDSLDRMEIGLEVEQQFGFATEEVPATLGDLWVVAQGLGERTPPKPPPPAWFRPPAGEGAPAIVGDTVPEAFVNRALADPGDVAAADDVSGAVPAGRMLVGALLLARRFAALPGANVGLLMPASVACDVAFLALQLAGKLPVVLNWTTGAANLAHAARLMELGHVVTSEKFIDRTAIVVEGTEYVCLEDLRKQAGKLEKLATFLEVRLLPGRVRRRVARPNPDAPAVVLFTSGSEKAPKAVPLTHRNLLSDERACIEALGITRRDSLLGFLPAFHSFGLSVTGLLPLLSGLRLVHHPDPTAAGALVRKIAAYRPTLLAGTPTFVGHILERAKPGQLDSLRLIVVGAEKAPQNLFERCAEKAPGAQVLEGYGITECSPVVSVNRPGRNRPGTVGPPVPGVEVCVVDLDSKEPLPTGRTGMLLVSGPTVFPGYIGEEESSPFRERDGKRWYESGDLAELDADGCIRLAGRLKRFLKAGGEMISLPALEEPFTRRFPPTEEGPRAAVEGVETEGGRRIVLFTTAPITLREANDLLLAEGFRGVLRLDEVRRVDRIPVLGTGKTDYKVLRALLTQPAQPAAGAARP